MYNSKKYSSADMLLSEMTEKKCQEYPKHIRK